MSDQLVTIQRTCSFRNTTDSTNGEPVDKSLPYAVVIDRSGVSRNTALKVAPDAVAILDKLNATDPGNDNIDFGVADLTCDRFTQSESLCHFAMIAWDKWDEPAAGRGRFDLAVGVANGGTYIHRAGLRAADEQAPNLSRCLHDIYGTEPVEVTRQREEEASKQRKEREAKHAEVEAMLANSRAKHQALAEVAECLLAPSAQSVAKMVAPLRQLLGL